MDLYVDPAATTSRAVLAFCEAEALEPNVVEVSLMAGDHHRPPLSELNPNRLVPVLDDGGFVLTESSAILRYLADKTGSAMYPRDLRRRARVDEAMAWFEANFYRDFGFQLIYPQLMPHHRRPTEEAHRITVEWGRERSRRWLEVLDGHFLRGDGTFLAGDSLTIADYHGASILSLGELVGCAFDAFPRVRRWYGAVRSDPSWGKVNGPFLAFVESLRGQPFVGLS